jgi:2-polyprenyl-3-methyl-5-hydroxy-6-metoxy-1,4-benzoquinol methylase
VLDLPCGEGMMIYAMREMGYRNVSGYDIDRNRLATGQKLGLPLHQGDVFEVLETRSDESVGCVLAMDFLEHVEKPQVIEFLSLVHRKLAHGGLFLARTPCASSPQARRTSSTTSPQVGRDCGGPALGSSKPRASPGSR